MSEPTTTAGRAELLRRAAVLGPDFTEEWWASEAETLRAIEDEARAPLREAAQAYIDWRDDRRAKWTAVAKCRHTDPFCPEMEAVRDEPFDKDQVLDDAIRQALADTAEPTP